MARRKTWDDLSPAYRKRLQGKGITKRKHDSPKLRKYKAGKRKSWDELTPAYRKRLLAKGIDAKKHASKKTNIEASRGHRFTPEHGGPRDWYAMAQKTKPSLLSFVKRKDLNKMTPEQQEQIAKDWIQGFIQRGKGTPLTVEEKQRWGIHRKDRRVYRHPSQAQVESKMDFEEFFSKYAKREFGSEDWKQYRMEYAESFSSAA